MKASRRNLYYELYSKTLLLEAMNDRATGCSSEVGGSFDGNAEFLEYLGMLLFEPLVSLEIKGHGALQTDHLRAVMAFFATKSSFVRVVVLFDDALDFA